jgi:hypothetical protein
MIIIENSQIIWNGNFNLKFIKDILSAKKPFQHITYYNRKNEFYEKSKSIDIKECKISLWNATTESDDIILTDKEWLLLSNLNFKYII